MKRWPFISLISFAAITLLIACGSTSTASPPSTAAPTVPAGYTEVQITLSDFKIASSLTSFTKGVPYFFVITNKGNTTHQFMIVPPMMGGHITTKYMDTMSFAVIENIHTGQTRTLEITFPKSAYPELEFACHYADHYAKGMHLPVHLV